MAWIDDGGLIVRMLLMVHPHIAFVFCDARDLKMEDWFAVFQLFCIIV